MSDEKCGCKTRYRRRVVRCQLDAGHEGEKHEGRVSDNEVLVWARKPGEAGGHG